MTSFPRLLSCSLALLCPFLETRPAQAVPRFEKSTKVVVKAPTTASTRIDPRPTPPATAPALREAAQLRERAATRVALLDAQATAALERLIKATSPDDPDRADLLFRLAERYREQQTDQLFKARELDQRIHLAAPQERGALEARQRRFEAEERRWLLRAIETYLAITENARYHGYRRLDEVLYGLADLLGQAGRHDRARHVFQRLIRNHPQSRYVPDAYLSFAEHLFSLGKIEDALRLYQQVARRPGSSLRGYALYKQGWCWLNLKDPRRALELFVEVIREASDSKAAAGRIPLLREARRDAVRAYSHVGSPEKAWAFFQRITPEHTGAMLELLGRAYLDQGKFPAAVQIYRRLMSLEPGSRARCGWQHAVVKATIASAGKADQAREAERLVEVLANVDRSGRATARAECAESAASVLRELATTWHREAQVTHDLETYRAAVRLYRLYQRRFPTRADSYELAYYLAEALYSLERWPECAQGYTRVVEMSPRGRHLRDAAYAAVICWKNAVEFLERPEQRAPVGEGSLRPLPFSPSVRTMMAAFQTFLRVVPTGDERVRILYRFGRIHYGHNHYAEAIPSFAALALTHPGHELAVYAANLLLDSLNALRRDGELERYLDRFLKEPRLARGELLAHLQRLKCQVRRRHLEGLQRTGRFRACGEGYAELANSCQSDQRWAELLHNAALCFESARMIGMAIATRTALIKGNADHPLARRALYAIAQNYHALAWYSRAADYYERFAKAHPGEPDAPAALQNAIVFRLGRGEHRQAADDVALFEKSYAGRPGLNDRAAAVRLALGSIYEGPAASDAARRHYQQYLARWGAGGGVDRQIVAEVRLGELLWAQSCPQAASDGPLRGLCARVERAASRRLLVRRRDSSEVRAQCGPDTKMRITLVKRSAAQGRAAQAHFEHALTLARRTSGSLRGVPVAERDRRQTELERAVASAHFHRAEQLFEESLGVAFPSVAGLSHGRRNGRPPIAFQRYLTEKSRRLEAARQLYQGVILRRVPHWAIASAARIGQLYQTFADSLHTAPIPTPPIPPQLTSAAARHDFRVAFAEAYCDGMADRAGPIEEKAVQGLSTCLGKATELSWYNEWSKLCEAELNQIRADVPLAVEIRAQPGYASPRLARVGLRTPQL